jgi:hypothetical protein
MIAVRCHRADAIAMGPNPALIFGCRSKSSLRKTVVATDGQGGAEERACFGADPAAVTARDDGADYRRVPDDAARPERTLDQCSRCGGSEIVVRQGRDDPPGKAVANCPRCGDRWAVDVTFCRTENLPSGE